MSPSKKCVENDLKTANGMNEKQLSSTITHKIRDEIQRKIHNGVEKRRKDKINTWINKIGELLPFKDPKRDSKNGILERTFHYIIHLKETNDKLMLGHVDEVQESELNEYKKRVKQLELTNSSYYKLLRTAGISACVEHSDLWKQRPTKYSNKISEEQVSSMVKKFSDDGDNSSDKSLSCESSSNKCAEEKTAKNAESTSTSSNGTQLNESNIPTVSSSASETHKPRNASNVQIRPTTANVQILPNTTTMTCDNGLTNNLLSGQIIIGHINPPPQPQTTALLLSNGQILPVVSQSQASLLFAPGTGLVLAPQLTSIQTNINTTVSKPTTTIEAVPASPEPEPPKTSKSSNEDVSANKIFKKVKSKNETKKPVKSKKMSKGASDEKKCDKTKSDGCKEKSRKREVTTANDSTMSESDILAKATESIFSPSSGNKSEEAVSNANSEKQQNKNVCSDESALQKDKLDKSDRVRNDELSNNDEPPTKRCKTTEPLTSGGKSVTNIVGNSEANSKNDSNTKNPVENERLLTSENSTEIFSENHRNEENLGGDQDSELPSILGLTEDNVISPESVNSVSNSNLSAYLSLSPDFLTKEPTSNNQNSSSQSMMSVSNLVPPATPAINTTSTINSQHPYIPSLNNFNSESTGNLSLGMINLNKDFLSHSSFIDKPPIQKHSSNQIHNSIENCVNPGIVHNTSLSNNLLQVSHHLTHQQQTSQQTTHHHHSGSVGQHSQQQHVHRQQQQHQQQQPSLQQTATQHQQTPPSQHQPPTQHQPQQGHQPQQTQQHHHQQIQPPSSSTFNAHQQQQSQTNEQRKLHSIQTNFQPQIHHQKNPQSNKQSNTVPYITNHISNQQQLQQQQMQQQASHSNNNPHSSTTSSSYSAEALLREPPTTNNQNYGHNLLQPVEQNNNYLSHNANTNNSSRPQIPYSSLPYSSVFSYSTESLLRQQPPTSSSFNYSQNLLPPPIEQSNYSHQQNTSNSNRPPISYSAESLLASVNANHTERRDSNKTGMRSEEQQDTYRRQYSQNCGQNLGVEQIVSNSHNQQQQSKHNRDQPQSHHQSHRSQSLQSQSNDQRKMHSMQTNFQAQIHHQKAPQTNKQPNNVTYPSSHHSNQQIQQQMQQQSSHSSNNHQPTSTSSSYSAEALLREPPTQNNYNHNNLLPFNVEQSNYSLTQNNSSNNSTNRPPISYSLPYSSAYSTESLLRQQPPSTFNYAQNWLPLPIEQSTNYPQHNASNPNRPPISYSAESLLASVGGSGTHTERRDANKSAIRNDEQDTYRRHYSQNCNQGVNLELVVSNQHSQPQQSKHTREQSQNHQQSHRTHSLQSQTNEHRKMHSIQPPFQSQMHHQKAPQKQTNSVPYLSSHHSNPLQPQMQQQSSHSSNSHHTSSSSYSTEALLREQPGTNYGHHNLLPLNVEQFIGISTPNSKSSAKRKAHF